MTRATLTAPSSSEPVDDVPLQERLTRVERAVAQLGEAMFGLSVTDTTGIRGRPDLTELIREHRAAARAAQAVSA